MHHVKSQMNVVKILYFSVILVCTCTFADSIIMIDGIFVAVSLVTLSMTWAHINRNTKWMVLMIEPMSLNDKQRRVLSITLLDCYDQHSYSIFHFIHCIRVLATKCTLLVNRQLDIRCAYFVEKSRFTRHHPLTRTISK